MTTMMDILGAAILFALVEIGVGILIVFMSRKMYKRTNALKFDTKIKQK